MKIKTISEGSSDTGDWNYGCWKLSFRINLIFEMYWNISQQIRIWWHANQLINSKYLQRFPEPSKWSQFGSLGYTITGKTADLTGVQKTIIDTLHKEGKTQTFITKEAGCSQSAVSKHVNRKLSGRKKCGRKRCTTNRQNRSLMRIVTQNQFKNRWTSQGMDWGWGQDIKNHHTQTCQGIWLQFSKMRASLVFHLETKVLESGGRVEKFLEVQC